MSLKFTKEGRNTMPKNLSLTWWLPLVISLIVLLSPLSLKCSFPDELNPVLHLPQERCSMRFVDAEVKDVLRLLAKEYKLNLIISENVSGVITVDFDQVLLEDIFFSVLKTAGLGYALKGDVILVGTQKELLEQKTSQIRELEKQAESNKKIIEAQEMVSEMIKVHNILNTKSNESIVKEIMVGKEEVRNLTQLAEGLKKMLSDRKGASIEVVDAANSLVITDIPDRVQQIVKLVKELDQPSMQVMIEARIASVSDDHLRDVGIQWGGKSTSGNFMLSGSRTRTWSTETTNTTGTTPSSGKTTQTSDTGLNNWGVDFPAAIASGQGATLGILLGNLNGSFLDAQLSALETNGKGKVLASPRVVTQDNQKAYIKVGQEIPIQSLTFNGGATTTTVTYKDAAIELEVSPHLMEEKVFMDIVVVRKIPDYTHAIQGNPPLLTQGLTTKISVKSGETFALGGLTTEEDTVTVNGVPYLSRIPLFRYFFKDESKTKNKEDLIIFITPTIINGETKGDADAQRIPG